MSRRVRSFVALATPALLGARYGRSPNAPASLPANVQRCAALCAAACVAPIDLAPGSGARTAAPRITGVLARAPFSYAAPVRRSEWRPAPSGGARPVSARHLILSRRPLHTRAGSFRIVPLCLSNPTGPLLLAASSSQNKAIRFCLIGGPNLVAKVGQNWW